MSEETSLEFDKIYREESLFGSQPPWEIGEPQPAFVELERAGHIRGTVLDVGCGTGENSLFFASRNYEVTGIDISDVAVQKAREKAQDRGLAARFEVDGSFGATYPDKFDTVVDSGLFHGLDPYSRRNYVEGLATSCKLGAGVHILAMSGKASDWVKENLRAAGVADGLVVQFPRTTEDDFHEYFTEGWTVEDVGESWMTGYFAGDEEPTRLSAFMVRLRRG